jgi:competence protein ComEA
MNLDPTKQQLLIIIVLIAILIIGGGVTVFRRMAVAAPSDILIEESPSVSISKIYIHISGAVKKRGVYQLTDGSRVMDAISSAGGATQNADLDAINLVEKLKDGQKIVVPQKIRRDAENTSGLISINQADEETLKKIPGVGKITAQRIVEYRSTHGAFGTIEDLAKVKGLSKKKVDKMGRNIRI